MHWQLPKRIASDVKWLIVYVALSRVRSLAQLKSIGLTDSLRDVIEGGPPPALLNSFEQLFEDKPERTLEKAIAYRAALGWPSSSCKQE